MLSSSCKREKQLKIYSLQKNVISTQKSLAVEKGVPLCKMASMKKVVKLRWQPRNGCDGRSVIKILITTIQVNFVLIPSEAGMR